MNSDDTMSKKDAAGVLIKAAGGLLALVGELLGLSADSKPEPDRESECGRLSE